MKVRIILMATALAASNGPAARGAPPENPLTAEKAILGKILFWDEQLSGDNTMACGTCHIPRAAGGDPRQGIHPGPDGAVGTPDDVVGSPGVIRSDARDHYLPDELFGFDPQVTGRQAPSFIGVHAAPELFWDGRASGTFVDPVSGETLIETGGALESQVVGPPTSDVEMAHESRNWDQIASKLRHSGPLALASDLPPDIVSTLRDGPTYPELFASTFGDGAITPERIAFAIASYERTLIADQTPFDLGTLTIEQSQGFNVFLGVCSSCHSVQPDAAFTDFGFHNIGVRPPDEDLGRQAVTGDSADRGKFKTPGLRNAGLRSRFFHNGSAATLEDVVAFYNRGGDFGDNQDPLIIPLNLPLEIQRLLIDFMANGLTDPRVAAELPPFDRPTLQSESKRANPAIIRDGAAGSGGFAPVMIAQSPPIEGAPGFKLGVGNALGGARAVLLLSNEIGSADDLRFVRKSRRAAAVTLAGTGPGEGYGTHYLVLDATPSFESGSTIFAQWIVTDPGGADGTARSAIAVLNPNGGTHDVP